MRLVSHRCIKQSLVLVLSFFVGSVALFAQSGVGTLDEDFKALAQSGARIIAIDTGNADSEIFTSDDDGATFTSRVSTTENYEALGAVGSTVLAVGINGLVLRSTDSGSTWGAAAEVADPTLNGALYGVAGRTDGANPNQWIAVGDDGFDGYVYHSTDDAQSWTEVEVIVSLLIEDVIWTGNRWLLCGRDSFNEGLVYSSTDGVNWSASTVPAFSAPLLALGHDGSGVVVAVGEQGQVLRSTDDGLTFTGVATELFSGDLNAVLVDGSGTFYLGGDEKTLIELNGTSASFLVPPAADASPVLDLVLINGVVYATGPFEGTTGVTVRTIPLDLFVSVEGTLDLRLSVTQSLSNKTYFLETSTNLINWDPLPSTSRLGSGASIFFDVSEDGPKRFWRVVEF